MILLIRIITNNQRSVYKVTQAILQLNALNFKANNKEIIKDINLTVNEGDFLTIMGPSGSGKSTLLKLIGWQIDSTSGSIQFKGKDINEYNPMDYRKEVSYFFQNAVLFGKTVRDNLSFPAEIREEEFDEQRALKGLREVQLPTEYLTKEINELSGGERQRVALIRNMMYPPKVLLMDEVTSSLDQENRQNILNCVKNLNEKNNTTILWVTHNQEEIDASNRLIKIIDGNLEEN